MPVPHLEIRIVQWSKGSSAVAGAAYQAGEKLFSEYDQKEDEKLPLQERGGLHRGHVAHQCPIRIC